MEALITTTAATITTHAVDPHHGVTAREVLTAIEAVQPRGAVAQVAQPATVEALLHGVEAQAPGTDQGVAQDRFIAEIPARSSPFKCQCGIEDSGQ